MDSSTKSTKFKNKISETFVSFVIFVVNAIKVRCSVIHTNA